VNLLSQGMRNQPMTVYGNGLQTRSFCYVSDLVEGIIAYAKCGETRPVNLGNNKEFTILELAEKIKKVTNNLQCPLVHQEMPVDDPKQRRPDLSLATKLLAWSPKVELEEGLRKTAQWLAQQSGSKIA
jgi:nucleoside-diphosphate-sugar epimerase